MQDISPVTFADLNVPVQELLYKLEVYDGATWWDFSSFAGTSPLPGWPYRKRIDLPIPTANLTDFPVKVPIVADADIGAHCRADGFDLRFTAADGVTLLPYERESFAVVSDAEHVLNGGFASDTANWTPVQCAIASVVGGQGGNCLELTRVSDAYQYFQQTITGLVIGKTYKLSGYVKSGTSGNESFKLQVGTSGHTPYVDGTSSGAWTKYSFEFTAIATSYEAWIYKMTATPGTMLFDTVSLKLADAGAATGIFWVKSDVAMAGTFIYCYFGNSAAPDVSSGPTVFGPTGSNHAAVYHMKDATTSTILDSTGNNNDGTKLAANEPIEAAGKIGKGQDYDGTNDSITVAHAASLNISNLTVEAWLKKDGSLAGHRRLVTKNSVAGYILNIYDETLEAYVAGQGVGFGDSLVTDVWKHVCMTFDGTRIKGYCNGALIIDLIWGGTIDGGTAPLSIGHEGGTRIFDGLMDEVRISPVARSAEWIAYEYANMNPADGGLTWGAEETLLKNHLKELSFAQGGAGVSPDPIAGTWSATVYNDDGIFHPRHPTSEYSDLLRIGRKIRLSIGALYNGVAKYWPRMVGYMDAPKFQAATKTVSLSGGDSMKALADTELRSPDNYWGAVETFSSVLSTDVLGSELYTQNDAVKNTLSDFDTMAAWTTLSNATIASVADDEGSGDLGGYNGQVTKTSTASFGQAAHDTAFSVTLGKLYKVSFRYKRVSVGCTFSLRVYETGTSNLMGTSGELSSSSWAATSYYFTATKSCVCRFAARITGTGTGTVCRFDLVSIKEVTSYYNTRYNMPVACNGVYAAFLDGVPLWYGASTTSKGWLYDPVLQVFYFDENSYIATGIDNLLVYYFTTQQIIDVLGDVLAATPLYATRAAALAAMDYVDPLIAVPKVWFEGMSALAAVRQICELCNYRFWFDELDVPHFLPAPTHGDAVAWFSTKTCSDAGDFQDLEEVRNRIVIQGIEQGAFSTAKDKKTSRMTCTDTHDDASIAAYLEKTHSITNDLFQDQAAMDAMAAALLAEFKDPKLYSDLRVPKNPIPLGRGDTIEWDIELRPPSTPGGADGLKNTVRGIIRDASFSGDGFNYKCEIRSTAMNIANYATGPVTVTAEHCKGWTLTNSGASGDVQFNLPAATVGMEINFYVLAAQTLTINPNGTERIAVLTGTNGDYLRSDAVIGSCITLECLVAGYWHKRGAAIGTWTEE